MCDREALGRTGNLSLSFLFLQFVNSPDINGDCDSDACASAMDPLSIAVSAVSVAGAAAKVSCCPRRLKLI
jgi:hypothetical protein